MTIFARQFRALCYKNWLVARKNWFINAVRCLILPVLYILFVAESQRFFQSTGRYGVSSQYRAIRPLNAELIGNMKFLWWDQSGNLPLSTRLINDITADLPSSQVIRVYNRTDLAQRCPENYNQVSNCFGAILFQSYNLTTRSITYQIRTDNGLYSTNVENGRASLEQRHLPIQWAADSAIFRFNFGDAGVPPTPLELPYTQVTQAEHLDGLRISLVRGTRAIIAIAFFIGFVGVIYHLVGFVSLEREKSLTQLLDVMGCSPVARLLSWHLSFDAFYGLSWLFSGVIIQQLLFTLTNGAIVIFFHLLFGLSIVSWSLFVGSFFKRAQLSGISATIAAVVLSILAMVGRDVFGPAGIIVLSIIFPPMSFIFGYIVFCNFERFSFGVDMTSTIGERNSTMLGIFLCLIVNIFLYFFLAILVEHWIYGSGKFLKSKRQGIAKSGDYSVEIKNLTKSFSSFSIKKKAPFVAVNDLTLSIKRGELYCLLGANGSGKSTTLGMISGSLDMTAGDIIVDGLSRRNDAFPPGLISLCPQRNILWDSLTVKEHIKIWSSIKSVTGTKEDLVSLIDRCDLISKIDASSETLSGGMKRKLQLAIAFCGDSKVILIDEVSSGIDPLARRKLHDIILDARGSRTQILTTHFLDEADLLADRIALLAKGSLRAQGVPVALKNQLGKGFTLNLVAAEGQMISQYVLAELQHIIAGSYSKTISRGEIEYTLPSTRASDIQQVLNCVESHKAQWGIASYDIAGPRLEDVFLHVMDESRTATPANNSSTTVAASTLPAPYLVSPLLSEKAPASEASSATEHLSLHTGRETAVWEQVYSQFRKRWTIAKRNPWPAISSVLVGVIAVGVSLVFLTGSPRYSATCRVQARGQPTINLTFPYFPYFASQPFVLGPTLQTFLRPFNITDGSIPLINGTFPAISPIYVDSSTALATAVRQNYASLIQGGIYIEPLTNQASFAWFIRAGTFGGMSNLNLISNVLFDAALANSGLPQNSTVGYKIRTTYRGFDSPAYGQLGDSLKFLIFFGVAMCVMFAFAALYPTAERLRDVKALHYSNGMTPFSLHMGHLLYELPSTALVAVIITILYAAVIPGVVHKVGIFFIVLWIYGITATLMSFVVALFAKSQLAAFAFAAGLQAVLFLLYLVAYLLTLTYAPALETTTWITYEHFTMSLLPIPIASITRAIIVGLNMFSLACIGRNGSLSSNYGDILLYGGPILYMIVHILLLFGFLVWYDSGKYIPRKSRHNGVVEYATADAEVQREADRVAASSDALVVRGISKRYGSLQALENMTFGVAVNEVFALLGPNSAGKSTTYGIIRGEVKPDTGDALIVGKSITSHKNAARASLGVCPQFDAMDALTVREHLMFYARIKGIDKSLRQQNVKQLIDAVSLTQFADRLARKLSGGNQRKLSLAISMIGNPSVLLIDEASSGMDIGAKRQIWQTLTKFMPGRAVVITTHSMEEADALATRVGIIAKRMLALGEISDIRRRYGDHYELAIICEQASEHEMDKRARDIIAFVLSRFPGASSDSERVYHGHLKFKIPVEGSVAALFDTLERNKNDLFIEYYGINRSSLESAFLKLIRQHNVMEEGYHSHDHEHSSSRTKSRFPKWSQ